MAAQPFDKETIDKVTEAFKNLNTETKKTLSDFDASVAAEKKMLDIAKQLGQEFKTQKDSLDDQLKGKNLQEQLQLKLKNSESELSTLSQSRINSQVKINSLQDELKKHMIELSDEYKKGKNLDPAKIDSLNKIIKSKVDESLLEKDLLKSSSDTLDVMQKEVATQKSLNNTLGKTVELVALIAGTEFIKDLNAPKSVKELFERTYTLFKQIDKSATDLRKQFGLFREDAEIIEKNIREIVIDLGEFGVKAEDVQKSMSAIGKTFNYIDVLDKSIVKDIAMMSKQMGISEEKSAKFLKTIGGIKGESGIANKSMLSFAGSVATAYGIGLDEVMYDVADASDDVRMYAGKTADELIIGAAQARQMGTTLDNMAKSSKSLLNFETSIQAELKASALIGKNINFNEARRLAFQGKTVEANKLILDQAKKIKFNQLNPIAQEAFAAAAGKSVKELQDMLESENRMKSALTSNNKEVRDAAKAQLEKQNLLKTNGKLAQDEYEKNLLNKVNQERIVVLQNRLNDALQKIMLPVLEALTAAMENLVNLTDGMDLTTLIKDLYAANILIKNTFASGITNIINKVKAVLNFPVKVVKALNDSISQLATKTTNFLMNKFSTIKNAVNFVKGYFINFELFVKDKFLSIGKYFQTLLAELKLLKFPLVDDLINLTNKLKSIFGGLKASQPFTFIKNAIGGLKATLDGIKTSFQPLTTIFKDVFTKLKGLNFSKFFGIGDLAKYLGPLKTILPFISKILTKIPLIGNVITAIQFLYESWKNVTEVLNNPNLTGLEKFGGIFKAIGKAAYTTLVKPFIEIGEWIGEKFFGSIYDVILDVAEAGYNIGASIWDGIKSITNSVINGIKNMFSSAWDSIKDWLGFSPSVLGLSIVKGIVSVGDDLLSAITSPFTKAFELIKSGLELIWEKMKGIGSFISETIGKTFNFVGRIIGVSEETTTKPAGETKTAGKSNDLLISTIVDSNRAVLEKLDKLTSMMASGQIAVYIDGQRANQLLATSNSKFGSFGQATTN
jgi:phage-related protein